MCCNESGTGKNVRSFSPVQLKPDMRFHNIIPIHYCLREAFPVDIKR